MAYFYSHKKSHFPFWHWLWQAKWYLLTILVFLVLLIGFWLYSLLGVFQYFRGDLGYLLGFAGGPRTYLVLFQNNAELRPSGGFISNYGVIKLRFGLPVSLEIRDSYTLETPNPVDSPAPMEALLRDPKKEYTGWQFRDSNYSPDFAQAAQKAEWFYQLQNPQAKFDGVFAFDLSFAEDLLRAVGPIYTNKRVITADNLFIELEQETKNIDWHSERDLEMRKNIIKSFAKNTIKKIIFTPAKWPAYTDSLLANFRQKHVLAYFSKESVQEKFEKLNFAGRLQYPAQSDFLAINEANFGGRKSDRYISREVEYFVKINEDRTVSAKLRIQFIHFGGYEFLSNIFQGYLRIYLPAEAKITLAEGPFIKQYDPADDMGYRLASGLINLLPKQKATFAYEYNLPSSVFTSGVYRLYLQKQPGTIDDRYRIFVEAPVGSTMASGTMDVRENRAFWDGYLAIDQVLAVRVFGDDKAPFPIEQQTNRQLNKVRIIFNEDVDEGLASNPGNYEIRDLNLRNVNADQIKITGAKWEGSQVILNIEGMTMQDEERYELKIWNIKDKSGNLVDPNPKVVTIVQKSKIAEGF